MLGATFATPAPAPACDSTGCLLLTRGQNGVMAKGTWRVDVSFRDTDQSDSRRGGAPTDLVLRPKVYFEQERVVPAFHLDRDGRERFLQVDVGYGLFERTTVFLSLPAATQRSHDVVHGTVNTAYDVWGVGDGVIGVRQALAQRGALVGGVALKAPLARHGLIDEYDGTILEPTLQPGSGAWSVVPSLQYSFAGLIPDVSWTASASHELTTANGREYRFGNESIATLGASRPAGRGGERLPAGQGVPQGPQHVSGRRRGLHGHDRRLRDAGRARARAGRGRLVRVLPGARVPVRE